jgi:uncharacterized membrane protein YeaQ/YmgE (transglycosylase-associated protein family)
MRMTAALPRPELQLQRTHLADVSPACSRHSRGRRSSVESGPDRSNLVLTGGGTSDSITKAMTSVGPTPTDRQRTWSQPAPAQVGKGASVILLFILVWGMFAGWIAHLLLARNQPINWAELLVVGLAGSFVGGLLISLLSGDGLALRPSGIIGSIVGAVVLLAAWQAIRPTPRRRTR